MSNTVIKVENLSKQYRLGEVGTGTLSHDLKRWWHKVQGKEDPFLKIGEANDRTAKGDSDYVWALKDINFEVKQGEVLGIIGRNGAGKSTLLKILSKTTLPTTGSIKVKGRIASLLEVGTGFHPEMTGRENIFLNGSILGMTKREIKKKFDEIVDFAGVERYIDTPVKRYSSGMYVRLAFAVAAHLEPEILIVDEVLAVGDAEFQKKCLGKMKDVSGEGRTVLFVSHNMGAIKTLCNKAFLLQKGMLEQNNFGDTIHVINSYMLSNNSQDFEWKHEGSGEAIVRNIYIVNSNNDRINEVIIGDSPIKILVDFQFIDEFKEKTEIVFGIYDMMGDCHVFFSSRYLNLEISPKIGCMQRIIFEFSPDYYPIAGVYSINICINSPLGYVDYIQNSCKFTINNGSIYHNKIFQELYCKSIIKIKAKLFDENSKTKNN